MKQTTLCYLIKDDHILLMHRNKKANDPNHGKWIGVGGHVELNETIEEAMKREVFEETGFICQTYVYHGRVIFHSDIYPSETMHLFSSRDFKGDLITSNEGTLAWVHIENMKNLNLWEGDALFLKHMFNQTPFFELSLYYQKDKLINHELKNRSLESIRN